MGIIGVEPFTAGVAKLVQACVDRQLGNVRIVVDDARVLLAALPDASIERAFVLFPDPWPKSRHHKRRILNPDTARELVRILAPSGELRVATDDPGYLAWILAALVARPELEWSVQRAADWRLRPPEWPATRYEAKALAAGRRCFFLRLSRRTGAPSAD